MCKEEIFQLVIRNICEVLPDLEGHDFKGEDKLVELGADSVDRAEVVSMTMEDLSLTIPRVALSGVNNIGGLAEVLYEKLQQS